jgi:DNA-binding NarL/FixJ family response regulator
MSRPHLLLVEDDARTAEVIVALLSAAVFPAPTVAASVAAAKQAIAQDIPDLVLLDLGLPDGDGVELVRVLRGASPTTLILVITSATAEVRILAALRAGANGYLLKEELDVRLALALRDLMAGGAPLSPRVANVVLQRLRQGARSPSVVPALTRREIGVLELLATGGSYQEIGQNLGVELNTVRSHVRSLYEKLGAENRAEAVNLAWNLGLLHG